MVRHPSVPSWRGGLKTNHGGTPHQWPIHLPAIAIPVPVIALRMLWGRSVWCGRVKSLTFFSANSPWPVWDTSGPVTSRSAHGSRRRTPHHHCFCWGTSGPTGGQGGNPRSYKQMLSQASGCQCLFTRLRNTHFGKKRQSACRFNLFHWNGIITGTSVYLRWWIHWRHSCLTDLLWAHVYILLRELVCKITQEFSELVTVKIA